MPVVPKSASRSSHVTLEELEMKRYQQTVGRLMFVMTTCRPDLAYSVGTLATKMTQPTKNASKALDHTMCYLKLSISESDRKYDLVYRQCTNVQLPDYTNKQQVNFICYVDANHFQPRSTSGYIYFWDGCLVDWSSRRQKLTQLSSTSAEWDALAYSVTNTLYWRDLLSHVGYTMANPVQTAEDNSGVVRWAQELFRGQFQRRKHIELRTFFVNDAVRNKQVDIVPVASGDQLADPMTKPLDFKAHQKMLGKILNYGQDFKIPISNPLMYE